MARPRIPIGKRLFLLVLQAGGSTTRARICRANGRNITSAQISRGIEQCGDLLEVTRNYLKGSHRPSVRLSVTMKGYAAAQALRPGWQPTRLATSALREWLAELLIERDPWALSLERARAAEAELKRLREAGWVRRPPKPRVKKTVEVPLPVILPPVDYSSSGGFRAPSTPATPPATFATGSVPTPASRLISAPSYSSSYNSPYYSPAPHADVRPTAQATPADSGLEARIKARGYTVRDGKVQYGGDRWIPISEWMSKESWRLG